MKKMSKLLALVLALTMVLTMATTAFAADLTALTDTGEITINNAGAGKEFKLYRVLDLAKTNGSDIHTYITNAKWAGSTVVSTYFDIVADSNIAVKKATFDATAFSKAVAEAGIASDWNAEPTTTGDIKTGALPYGYYVLTIKDSKDEVQYATFTLYKDTFEITQKEPDLPQFVKEVMEDSTTTWGESNNAQIGQEVNFKLTITVASGTDTYTVKDTLGNFELVPGSIVVKHNGTTLTENTDYTLTAGGFDLIFTADCRAKFANYDVVTVEYKAKLTTNATIGGTGNINTATLDHGGTDITDVTTTYTYELKINKVDKDTNAALADAHFEVYAGSDKLSFTLKDGAYWVDAAGTLTEVVTAADGTAFIKGLDSDKYVLKETQTPAGYSVIVDSTDVTIAATAANEVTIENIRGEELPETGGMGTTLFYVFGSLMAVGAAVLLITKKRMIAE